MRRRHTSLRLPGSRLERRGLLLVPVLGAMLLALAACNSASPAPKPTTYTYETNASFGTLDPVQAYSTNSGAVLENVYQTLYGYTKTSGATPVPLLATGYTVTPDGKTYTFDLRQNVHFQSGNTLTCADVEYSIERALVTNPPSSGVWTLALPLTGTKQNANSNSSVTWSLIDNSVTCPNAHQVVFHLQQANPAFVPILAQTTYGIVDSTWAKSHGEWDGTQATWQSWVGADLSQDYMNDHASGTGPYELTAAGSSGVTAKAFTGYWGGAPSIDSVTVRYVASDQQRAADLLSGTADRIDLSSGQWSLVQGKSGVAVDTFPSQGTLDVHGILFNEAISGTTYTGSGTLDGNGIPANFFADLDTRLCFAYSFDPTAYINNALDGQGTQLTMMLPPSLPGYNSSLTPYSTTSNKAAGYCQNAQGGQLMTKGFTLTAVAASAAPWEVAALQDLQTNLAAISSNFHLKITTVPYGTLLGDIPSRTMPLFAVGWAADYAAASDFLIPFYESTGYYASNIGFSDSAIDSDIQTAYGTLDAATRASLYQDAGAKAYAQAPLIPLPTGAAAYVLRTDLKGTYYNPAMNGGFLWKDVSK